jgi:pyruvate, water dikinase
MEKFIKKFSEISINDIAEVGGKNASLGEMFNHLTNRGLQIPDGFSITSSAYKHFIGLNHLEEKLQKLMDELDRQDFSNLTKIGAQARKLILDGSMPADLKMCIIDAYDYLFDNAEQEVAVRSSATAEDLPEASFAGQHESYLNIKGHYALINSVTQCFASLYKDLFIQIVLLNTAKIKVLTIAKYSCLWAFSK